MQAKFFLTTILLLGGLCIQTMAQGDLLITPNRVIFEGRKQKEELNLINTGTETTTFSVSFVQRRMNVDGSFEIIEVPDSGQMFADPYLRVYPRTVTLEPGEAQVVMVQCTRKPDMQDGEFRSHLYFRSEKNYNPLGYEDPTVDTRSLSVQVVPIFGMSIPIIIHSGKINVSASLSDLNLETDDANNTFLTFNINRTGNISAYGNIMAEYIPEHGKPYQIGAINGVAVYTNIAKRHVSLKLDKRADTNFKKGKIRLSYNSRDDAKVQEVFAEAVKELM